MFYAMQQSPFFMKRVRQLWAVEWLSNENHPPLIVVFTLLDEKKLKNLPKTGFEPATFKLQHDILWALAKLFVYKTKKIRLQKLHWWLKSWGIGEKYTIFGQLANSYFYFERLSGNCPYLTKPLIIFDHLSGRHCLPLIVVFTLA